MHPQSSRTVLDVDTILGLPRPTKKLSSMRKPRQPPPPMYINKERALAIAKKFKIKQIGKVSVRAGSNNTLDDPPSVSLQSEKVLTRKLLLDREKGLETAINTKDSAVGKCILGRNDYETRRLGVELDKLNDDSERKSYQLLKRKSVFVHQRGLTLTQGSIVFDPTADTKNRGSSDSRDPSKPLPAIQTTSAEGIVGDNTSNPKGDKSPSYMRPLSCNRTRSADSQVAETERFLASPTMIRYTKVNPDEDSTVLALKSLSDVNTLDFDGRQSNNDTGRPSKRIFQTESIVRRTTELPEIAESVTSEGSENDNVFRAMDLQDGKTKFKNEQNFPITTALSRCKAADQGGNKLSIEALNGGHSTAYSGLTHTLHEQTFRKPINADQKKETTESEETDTKGRASHVIFRRRSHRKSPTFSTTSLQFKRKKKHRKNRVSSQQPAPKLFNTAAPAKDPRFTKLTSFLIPDSAKAFDLYRDMGRLSVLDSLQQSGVKSSGLRTKMGKIGHTRKSDNLKTFDAMF